MSEPVSFRPYALAQLDARFLCVDERHPVAVVLDRDLELQEILTWSSQVETPIKLTPGSRRVGRSASGTILISDVDSRQVEYDGSSVNATLLPENVAPVDEANRVFNWGLGRTSGRVESSHRNALVSEWTFGRAGPGADRNYGLELTAVFRQGRRASVTIEASRIGSLIAGDDEIIAAVRSTPDGRWSWKPKTSLRRHRANRSAADLEVDRGNSLMSIDIARYVWPPRLSGNQTARKAHLEFESRRRSIEQTLEMFNAQNVGFSLQSTGTDSVLVANFSLPATPEHIFQHRVELLDDLGGALPEAANLHEILVSTPVNALVPDADGTIVV